MMRIPAAELRGRLVSIEDHVSRRFKPNEQMTRLLVGMIRSVAELFIDSPPPNPQALATEIISFVALTIGSEDRGAATDVRNARYHLRRRIVDFIESHLERPVPVAEEDRCKQPDFAELSLQPVQRQRDDGQSVRADQAPADAPTKFSLPIRKATGRCPRSPMR